MAKLLTNRTDNDIKNKWYSMKRKEERQGLHEPSIYPKNLANRASAGEDTERTGSPIVPEEIAKRAMEVVSAAHGTAEASLPEPPAEHEETAEESFTDRNWSPGAAADSKKASI